MVQKHRASEVRRRKWLISSRQRLKFLMEYFGVRHLSYLCGFVARISAHALEKNRV
jgi:hypothetical protein